MTEYEALVREFRDSLQVTSKEQDILDGGDGQPIYIFTDEDVIDALVDWGTSGAESDKNIRTLFNSSD
jgi:hypothetical protein